jgi:hypothetical protein
MSRQSVLPEGDVEILAAARVLTRDDNAKTFFLNLAGGFDVTLPKAERGLRFEFVVKTAPTTSYTVTAATADTMVGLVLSAGGEAGDVESTVGADVVNFVANQAVVGDTLTLRCDGTYWYGVASCAVAAGMTFTG